MTTEDSLVVAGVGVMNIMLVSVVERTCEIGLRLALGARERDVVAQFLFESLLLSVVGGVCGIAVGYGLASAATLLFSWPTDVAIETTALAFGVSAAVRILFGWYPARRAGKIDPIDALRFE